MSISRKRGATLSLVVGLTFLLILIGVACFFLIQMIGGGGQLQHATDSGNLNVAKNALKTPYLAFPNDIPAANQSDVQENFSTVFDTVNGTQAIDLLTYNRLVGQAFLISMNAAADGYDFNLPPNPEGIADAQHVIQLLNDPTTGIGSLLAQKLKNDPGVNANFLALAQAPVLNMLGKDTLGTGETSAQDVSYMCQPSGTQRYASNVFLNNKVIPTKFQSLINGPDFVSEKINGTNYAFVSGYAPLSVPGVTDNSTNMLMGVPLRPGQEPHIVDTSTFNFDMLSPAPGGNSVNSCVPPNAFKSAGQAYDLQTKHSMTAISCAISGCLNGQYSISLPAGFLVVANGPGSDPTTAAGAATLAAATAGPGPGLASTYVGAPYTAFTLPSVGNGPAVDIFSTILMPPNGIYVSASSSGPTGAITKVAGVIAGIETTKFNIQQLQQQILNLQSQIQQLQQAVAQGPSGDPNYAADMATLQSDQTALNNAQTLLNTANTVTLPALIAQLDEPTKQQDAANLPSLQVPDEVLCTNINTTMPGLPGSSACAALLSEMESVYGGTPTANGATPNGGGNVSAIEWLNQAAIVNRASGSPTTVDPKTSGNVSPPFMGSACSGVTAYNYQDFPTGIGQPASLNNLLGSTTLAFGGYPSLASNANIVLNEITSKLYQMRPDATPQDIQNVLNTAIAPGEIGYIRVNVETNQFLVSRYSLQGTLVSGDPPLPGRIDPNDLKADGTAVALDTGSFDPVDTSTGGGIGLVDVSGEDGYPHPYDCQSSQPSTDFRAVWTPSSGTDGLEGIIRFENCVNISAPIVFSCPC